MFNDRLLGHLDFDIGNGFVFYDEPMDGFWTSWALREICDKLDELNS